MLSIADYPPPLTPFFMQLKTYRAFLHLFLDNLLNLVMRSFIVIQLNPSLGYLPHFIQASEDVAIQYIVTIGSVKPFNVGILVWATRRNVVNLNSCLLAQLTKASVVDPNFFRITVPFSKLVEITYHPQ